MTTKSFSDAYNTGFEASDKGEFRQSNPYAPGTWDSSEWLSGFYGEHAEGQYRIAFTMESGEWDVVEEFTAASDDCANRYAKEKYSDKEWFVLDASGKNINGGE